MHTLSKVGKVTYDLSILSRSRWRLWINIFLSTLYLVFLLVVLLGLVSSGSRYRIVIVAAST